jgi:FkbM family methyltransferase
MRSRAQRFLETVAGRLKDRGLARLPLVRSLWDGLSRLLAPRGILEIEVRGHTMLVDSRDKGVARSLLRHGDYESYETDIFESLLRPGQTVVDAGANIGYYTLIAARGVGAEGKVFAFEPEPANMALLKRNVERNGYSNVVAIRAALSRSSGKARLFTDRGNLAAASLSEGNLPEARDELHDVETVRLDDLDAARIDLLKMDTQGSEAWIIEGGEVVLRRSRPVIITEFWPFGLENVGSDAEALLGELLGFGYRARIIDEGERRLRDFDRSTLVAACRQDKGGRGYVNLLLEPR